MAIKNFLTIIGFCFLCALGVKAQDNAQQQKHIPFNGIIEDAHRNPIKGAKVWVVSDTRYAKTDKQGHFGLTDVFPNDTLHVKYDSRIYDIPVNGKKSIRIRIDEGNTESEEDQAIANTGYGFVKKREIVVASAGISGELLIRTGQNDIISALDGLAPGLTVENGQAYVRSMGNFNSVDTPALYIVDGIEQTNISYISLYDVDSVEVLKDGSMYGSRGANGVILVHTKKAKR